MRDGALLIGEAGLTGKGKIAAGYWRYTERQPDLRAIGAGGDPLRQVAQGAYLLGERRIAGSERGRQLSGFTRIGLSDGDTSAYRGGWQAGLLLDGLFSGQPGSQLSFGVNQAYLSRKYRRNARDAGAPLGRTETGFELTYSHAFSPFFTVQPDVQYILNPSADPSVRDALVVGLRFAVSVPGGD